MANTENKPIVLLVQGAFHVPNAYFPLVKELEDSGYTVLHPRLPTITDNGRGFTKQNLLHDALAVRMELTRVVESDQKEVVVVAHSYGGVVTCEAVLEELSRTYRRERGLPGGVSHLFLCAAILMEPHKSLRGAFADSLKQDVPPGGRCFPLEAQSLLYHDLPEAEAAQWAARLVQQSSAVYTTVVRRDGFRQAPSTYLVCEHDRFVPMLLQEEFAALAGSRVERLACGNSPQLSQTAALAAKIREAVARAAQ